MDPGGINASLIRNLTNPSRIAISPLRTTELHHAAPFARMIRLLRTARLLLKSRSLPTFYRRR